MRVTGRVQGVWYRQSCKDQAVALGVVGWARNLDDGSVEVVAQGNRLDVDRLETWCRTGPPRALVTSVTAHDLGPDPSLQRFVTR